MPRLLLARHGETVWNRQRRVQGWAPVGLAGSGREQARCLGRHVAAEYEVDRVRCSDLRRAVETARLATRELDVPRADGVSEPGGRSGRSGTRDRLLERDPAWRERDFGVLQGLSRDALFEGHPEFAVDEAGHAAVPATPEGGESLLDLRERVLRAADDLLSDLAADETALVVTHGGPLRLVLGAALDLDLVAAVSELDPPNCSVTELAVPDGALTRAGDDGSIEIDDGPGEGGDGPGEGGDGPGDGSGYEPRFPASVSVERRTAAPFLDAGTD